MTPKRLIANPPIGPDCLSQIRNGLPLSEKAFRTDPWIGALRIPPHARSRIQIEDEGTHDYTVVVGGKPKAQIKYRRGKLSDMIKDSKRPECVIGVMTARSGGFKCP